MIIKIYFWYLYQQDQLWYCIDQRLPLLLAKGQVKLIVVDSLAALFRCEFEPGEMFSRAKQLQRFGGKLHYLSRQHNVPVICVNQVSRRLKTGSIFKRGGGKDVWVYPQALVIIIQNSRGTKCNLLSFWYRCVARTPIPKCIQNGGYNMYSTSFWYTAVGMWPEGLPEGLNTGA